MAVLYHTFIQVMDRDTIQGIAVKFETTPSEIARINKKPTLTFSIFPGDVSYCTIHIIACCSSSAHMC